MNLPAHWIFAWPQLPALPPPGQPVLIRLDTTAPRQQMRQELRNILRQVLTAWSGQSPGVRPSPGAATESGNEALGVIKDRWPAEGAAPGDGRTPRLGQPARGLPSLRETPLGPRWDGELAGHSLAISLSYGGEEAWIGLLRGGAIGIDVMSATNFTEVEIVSRLYLGPSAWSAINQSPHPARAFALAWTALEARLKCLKQPLTEWPANQIHPAANLPESNVAQASSPAGSGGVSPPVSPTQATHTRPAREPAAGNGCAALEVYQYSDDHQVVTVATGPA